MTTDNFSFEEELLNDEAINVSNSIYPTLDGDSLTFNGSDGSFGLASPQADFETKEGIQDVKKVKILFFAIRKRFRYTASTDQYTDSQYVNPGTHTPYVLNIDNSLVMGRNKQQLVDSALKQGLKVKADDFKEIDVYFGFLLSVDGQAQNGEARLVRYTNRGTQKLEMSNAIQKQGNRLTRRSMITIAYNGRTTKVQNGKNTVKLLDFSIDEIDKTNKDTIDRMVKWLSDKANELNNYVTDVDKASAQIVSDAYEGKVPGGVEEDEEVTSDSKPTDPFAEPAKPAETQDIDVVEDDNDDLPF